MIKDIEDFKEYILQNFSPFENDHPFAKKIRANNGTNNWSFIDFCVKCDAKVRFDVKTNQKENLFNSLDINGQYTQVQLLSFECCDCKSKSFWLIYKINGQVFKLFTIPQEKRDFWSHGLEDLPKEPAVLRSTFLEATTCLQVGCPNAAVTMFRRALQIITRDILGAKPGNLADEIKSLIGASNKLGVILTNDFQDYGDIIRKVGNQGAHPVKDPDLVEMSMQDAEDIYALFTELIFDVFTKPAEIKKIRERVAASRKL